MAARGRSGQWRYDQALAVSGQPQVLAPNAVSQRRWLEFTGTTWSQTSRIKLPTVATQVGSVPAVAPDSIPYGIAATANIVNDGAGGSPYVRNHISLYFFAGTAQALRQAAVGLVNGTVVGGVRLANGDGFYIVRLPADMSAATTDAAIAVLRQRPEVRLVLRYLALPFGPTYLRPNDGPGFGRSDWNVSNSHAWNPSSTRTRWALEAIRAPLAWGCATGDSLTRVAVFDQGFFTSAVTDLVVNVVSARIVNVFADAEPAFHRDVAVDARHVSRSGLDHRIQPSKRRTPEDPYLRIDVDVVRLGNRFIRAC